MTCRAPAFAEEDPFSSRRVAAYLLLNSRPAEAVNIAHQLPDLVSEHVESRHLRTGNPLVDILKDLSSLAAMQEVAPGERWPAAPASVTAVTDLAGLFV